MIQTCVLAVSQVQRIFIASSRQPPESDAEAKPIHEAISSQGFDFALSVHSYIRYVCESKYIVYFKVKVL